MRQVLPGVTVMPMEYHMYYLRQRNAYGVPKGLPQSRDCLIDTKGTTSESRNAFHQTGSLLTMGLSFPRQGSLHGRVLLNGISVTTAGWPKSRGCEASGTRRRQGPARTRQGHYSVAQTAQGGSAQCVAGTPSRDCPQHSQRRDCHRLAAAADGGPSVRRNSHGPSGRRTDHGPSRWGSGAQGSAWQQRGCSGSAWSSGGVPGVGVGPLGCESDDRDVIVCQIPLGLKNSN
jgi:hypothetical protein